MTCTTQCASISEQIALGRNLPGNNKDNLYAKSKVCIKDEFFIQFVYTIVLSVVDLYKFISDFDVRPFLLNF